MGSAVLVKEIALLKWNRAPCTEKTGNVLWGQVHTHQQLQDITIHLKNFHLLRQCLNKESQGHLALEGMPRQCLPVLCRNGERGSGYISSWQQTLVGHPYSIDFPSVDNVRVKRSERLAPRFWKAEKARQRTVWLDSLHELLSSYVWSCEGKACYNGEPRIVDVQEVYNVHWGTLS